ncbi:flagellar protein FlhE [Halomonas sp. WWR20]
MRLARLALGLVNALSLVLAVGMLSVSPAWAAAGSWVAQGKSVLLTTPGRLETSKNLQPPAESPAHRGRITRVRWRYQAPPDVTPVLEAWLCHPTRCTALPAGQGTTEALAGLPADSAVYFRFRLSSGVRHATSMRVKGLQVIVDYQ